MIGVSGSSAADSARYGISANITIARDRGVATGERALAHQQPRSGAVVMPAAIAALVRIRTAFSITKAL